MAKMWAGRTSGVTDSIADDFNSSIRFDCKMYKQDITGSMAHAAMLGAKGIIAKKEADILIDGLQGSLEDLESGALEFDIRPVFDYWAGDDKGGASGQVFAAEIHLLGPLPQSEMAEIRAFDEVPPNVTYPAITPEIFAHLEEMK